MNPPDYGMTGPRNFGWRRCRWAMAGLAPWSLAAPLLNTCSLMKKSLWSGYPRDHTNRAALGYLSKVREAVFAGDYAQADRLAKQMQGPYTQSFLPFGDLYLEFEHSAVPEDYRRWLNLNTAVHHTTYRLGDADYTREMFISAPANALVMRLACSRPGKLSFRLRMESPLQAQAEAFENQLLLTGKAPQQDDPDYLNSENPVVYGDEGMTFAARLDVRLNGGSLAQEGNALVVSAADQVMLTLAAATSYNGFDRSPASQGKDPLALTAQTQAALQTRSYTELMQEHLAEYQPLFQRVALRAGRAACASSPLTSASLPSTGPRPIAGQPALPVRALPADSQFPPAHPAGQPAGHLE